MTIPFDKKMHFVVCFTIAAGAMILFRVIGSPLVVSCFAAWLTAMGAGLGKEWGDECNTHNKWSWGDILADFIGAVLGTLLMTGFWFF